jgi:hypothetical protein
MLGLLGHRARGMDHAGFVDDKATVEARDPETSGCWDK